MKKDKNPSVSAVLGVGLVCGAALLGRKRKTEEKPQAPVPAPVIKLETELKNRLTEFLEQDRFSLVIQPVVDFRDNTVLSGEALACLHHPELGAEVVCEGIETAEQDRFAREAGCHYGQGFLYFKPMDQSQVFEKLQKCSIREDNT